MIKIEYNQYSNHWFYRSEGKILPNCLCDYASGSKSFLNSFLALKHAKKNGVDIANSSEFYHSDWLG